MGTNILNKWEELFIDFLEMTEFYLRRKVDENDVDCYGLVDGQHANLCDIESEFFHSASEILSRMETYEYDYIICDLQECATQELIYDQWIDLLKYRHIMPHNQYAFDLIDMICNHPQDININKVYNYLNSYTYVSEYPNSF